MIVAGIGCRRGVGVDEVLAAIDAALAAHGLARDRLGVLATMAFKRDETAIFAAGCALALEVLVVEFAGDAPSGSLAGNPPVPASLPSLPDATVSALAVDARGRAESGGQAPSRSAAAATLTCSPLSLAHAGTSSVSEAAALAAAGPGARLLGPRAILGRVTCAIAVGDEP